MITRAAIASTMGTALRFNEVKTRNNSAFSERTWERRRGRGGL